MVAKVERIKLGDVFGRLTAEKDAYPVGKYLKVDVVCVCGARKTVDQTNLKKGRAKSCGCLNIDMVKERLITHGKTGSPVYAVWNMMRQRCLLPTNKQYAEYGGRGITVCDKWKTFEGFYEDMGDPPFEKASIDREDNNQGYSKDNCKWATRNEQNNNKRNCVRYNYKGQNLTLKEVAELVGIKEKTLSNRLYKYGMAIEDAADTPVIPSNVSGAMAGKPLFTKIGKRQDGHKLYGETK